MFKYNCTLFQGYELWLIFGKSLCWRCDIVGIMEFSYQGLSCLLHVLFMIPVSLLSHSLFDRLELQAPNLDCCLIHQKLQVSISVHVFIHV